MHCMRSNSYMGLVGLERSLFLAFNDPLVDEETLPLPNLVHVLLCHVLAIAFLTQVLELLLSPRYPEWVNIKHLEASEDELWAGCARGPFSDLVCEAKRLDDWEDGPDGKERRALFHLLRCDMAASARENGVDFAQDIG